MVAINTNPAAGDRGARQHLQFSDKNDAAANSAIVASQQVDPNRQQADPRMVFLLRAAVKFDLVEAGAEDLDDAIADLVHALHMLAPCQCQRQILTAFKEHDLETRRRRLAQWRRP